MAICSHSKLFIVLSRRFGWYLPASFVENLWNDSRIIADNWRALKLQSVIGQLLQNTSLLNSYMNVSEYKKSCDDVTGCNNGWLHGAKCSNGNNVLNCAVLLADFPGEHSLQMPLYRIFFL